MNVRKHGVIALRVDAISDESTQEQLQGARQNQRPGHLIGDRQQELRHELTRLNDAGTDHADDEHRNQREQPGPGADEPCVSVCANVVDDALTTKEASPLSKPMPATRPLPRRSRDTHRAWLAG